MEADRPQALLPVSSELLSVCLSHPRLSLEMAVSHMLHHESHKYFEAEILFSLFLLKIQRRHSSEFSPQPLSIHKKSSST